MKQFVAAVLLAGTALPLSAQDTLVDFGSTWKYLDDGSDQGTAWRTNGFNDAAWSSGPAELGYGDGDEATVVSFGGDAANKYITTYFRQSFNVVNAASYVGASLEYVFDDGGVVYINGTEVFRTSNLPGGAITYLTQTGGGASGTDGKPALTVSIDPSALQDGANVIAVEIHQTSPTSSDISLDLKLTATTTASVDRGPWLQIGTDSSIIVKWRTNAATDSRVRIGNAPGNLVTVFDDGTSATNHEVAVTGLSANTQYYYSVGTTSTELAGNDASHFFVTAPTPGTIKATRVWVLGDSGTANANARNVRDAYATFTGATHTDLWLMLGDNAYNSGTDAEYQAAVFDTYPSMLRKSVLWPTLGNHDAASSDSPTESGPYYNIFTLPKNGEAGGLASGTESYYSFDYANVHFVCLDSADGDLTPPSAMLTWLQNDLGATTQDWIIAFWHHPPYTKGSHNSDTEGRLINMRANFNPLLEANGVDLVLAGHSHSYERSMLIDGHYGDSTTFNLGTHAKDSGDGDPAGNGAYTKGAGTPANEGAVYITAGSSGKISGGSLDHPSMIRSINELASVVLDINDNQLDVRMIRDDGVVRDLFRITKGSPASVTITANDADGGEPANNGQFTVTRTGDTGSPLNVSYTVAAGGSNASPGSDYQALSGSVTIPGGSSTATIDVTVMDDATPEGTETVTVTLAAGPGYAPGAPDTATVNITDDDVAALTFVIADASMSENGGSSMATVSRNTGTSGNLIITLSSSDTGEATVPASVTIPNGSSSTTFTVTAVDEAIADGTQTVTLTASASGHAGDSDTIDVTDDDVAALTLVIADASMSENGGSSMATVSRNTGTSGNLTVTLSSSDTGEATVPASVTIPNGSSSTTFTVTAVDEAIADGTQTVTITVSASGHSGDSDTIDVTDDDTAALTLVIADASMSENGGSSTATVSRNTGTSGNLTITLSSSDTTEATVPVSVIIPNGSTNTTFLVTGVDDGLIDGTQTVTVTATATGHAGDSASIDVTDDDGLGLSVDQGGPPVTPVGPVGGPFSPDSFTYTLTNNNGIPIDWTATADQPWLILSLAGGTLASGASVTVTVTLDPSVTALPAGTWTATIQFVNTTDGTGSTTRDVTLVIQGFAAPGTHEAGHCGALGLEFLAVTLLAWIRRRRRSC